MARILPEAAAVLKNLETAGYEAYLVGGCVRDLLRGETPADWDIATSALPEQTMALFRGTRCPRGCSMERSPSAAAACPLR